MTDSPIRLIAFVYAIAVISACAPVKSEHSVDLLIQHGNVYQGEKNGEPVRLDVGITAGKIVFIGNADARSIKASRILDATGLLVTAGFIDPHTHSLGELLSHDRNANLNYLYQGVTTVVNGNDGDGDPDVAGVAEKLVNNGIGTNTALFIGHGTLRRSVMGGANRAPTDKELARMKALVGAAMQNGALGLSTGLFYAPGSYANTEEIIALSRVAAQSGGIYDSHVRDESSYTVGLLAAIDEALEIGRKADIPVHISHIKALGVDVWGDSKAVIARIEAARASGQTVHADQYPWSASGTHLHNALLPKSFLEGDTNDYIARLGVADVRQSLAADVTENLRRRGGADSILIVVAANPELEGRTLADIAGEMKTDPVATAFEIMQQGSTRIASFNMLDADIKAFMSRDWVMTSSDGTDGHPRKFASFPKKYRDFVAGSQTLSLTEFLYRSSALTAAALGLGDRGRIDVGMAADIVVLDVENFAPAADFATWNALSTGVVYAVVNGQLAIDDSDYTGALAGRVLSGPGVH